MQENKTGYLKKLIVIIILACVIGLIIGLGFLTKGIISFSYKTEDVLLQESTAPEEDIEEYIDGYSLEEFNSLSSIDKTIIVMNNIPTDDLLEASIKKSSVVLSCKDSPYHSYMSSSEYTAGEVSRGYKVDYVINNEKISVICSKLDATPVVYIKDTEFTDDEKEFFRKLGKSWEVQLDDGTYSIQYR